MKIFNSIKNLFSNTNDSTREIEFKSNGILTLGVEIELQLIDPTSYKFYINSDNVIKLWSGSKKLKPELFTNTVEINTDKCTNVHEIEKDITESFIRIKEIADKISIKLATTGCHPFSSYSDFSIYPTPRYHELIDRNQWLARRTNVFGLHVHIGMESGDDCIRYNNFFMNFTPHLLALSASSPFWQGVDTGLASCRPTTYEALPTAGQPYRVRNWREFEHLYEVLKKCGSVKSLKDLWWDLRPSPGYGTLEIRVCDGPATLNEALAITAFIHGLAYWFQSNADWLESMALPPQWMVRENKWRAMRYGLNADLVINSEGKTKSLKDDLKEWVSKISPYTEKLGYEKYIGYLFEICEHGSSSDRQRKIFQKTNSLEEVTKFNIAEFENQQPVL